jgi:hypothetical protein
MRGRSLRQNVVVPHPGRGAGEWVDERHEAIAVRTALLQPKEVARVRYDHDRFAIDAYSPEHIAARGWLQFFSGKRLTRWEKVISY